MHALRVPRLRWCSSRAPLAGELRAFEGMEVACAGPSALSAPGADVLLVDADAFTNVDELLLARRGVHAPLLVRARAADVDALCAGLDADDEICLDDAPPVLIARRVRQLAARAAEAHDPATGLANRRGLLSALEARLQDAREDHPLSVLIVGVDLFEAINDECGHSTGDEVLREVAKRIAQIVGPQALLGRLGGDELCVVIDADDVAAMDVAQAVRASVADALMPLALRVTVTVGAATARAPTTTSELLRHADEALYAAKARGADHAAHWSDLQRAALAADQDVGLSAFENLTRVISERVAVVIAQRGRRLFRELRHEADVDGLTGLFNRRYLDRRLQWEIEEAARSGAPLSIALFDVDWFGAVNKEHGWTTGDRALREISSLVKDLGARRGWAARYGGEELCLVMPGTTLVDAAQVVEETRTAVASLSIPVPSGGPLRLTVSAGVAQRDDGDSVDALYQRASDRLLSAKRGGRDVVRA